MVFKKDDIQKGIVLAKERYSERDGIQKWMVLEKEMNSEGTVF